MNYQVKTASGRIHLRAQTKQQNGNLYKSPHDWQNILCQLIGAINFAARTDPVNYLSLWLAGARIWGALT